jgi:Ca2+-transporting ATPase
MTAEGEQDLDEDTKNLWFDKNEAMAAEGLRVLGLAEKKIGELDAAPYEKLSFIGLVGLIDPPRQDVKQSLAECRSAGVRVIMATGDQPVTARAIGYAVGLVDSPDATVIHGKDLQDPESLSEQEIDALLDLLLDVQSSGGELWDQVLTISIKPFMDAWTYDQDRIDQCCVHILDREGNPVSFCEYNAINRPRMNLA